MRKISLHPIEDKDIDWWLGRLEGVKASGNGWKAKCPAHRDLVESLQVTIAPDGEVIVHDFAGCTYAQILEALGEGSSSLISKNGSGKKRDPKEWWEGYTGIPLHEWESWGLKIEKDKIVFTWPGLPIVKVRKVGTKEFSWVPKEMTSPPLWPYPCTSNISKRIFMTEGETDAGVLRHLGLCAFAITKGAQTPLSTALSALRALGVEEIVAIFDSDTGGLQGVEKLMGEAKGTGIVVLPYPTHLLVDPLAGEKDLRDFWLRTKDPDLSLSKILERVPQEEKGSSTLSLVDLDGFMSTSLPPEEWLVEDIWLANTIGVLAGAPKMGKSWLALDLALSIASGEPFLGEFNVPTPGPVVIVPKEDPNFLLQDRLSKILTSKGLSGKVELPHIEFPRRGLPFYLDLTRSFLFSGGGEELLFEYLRDIYKKHGSIKAVILDPILRMLAGIDEFKASEVSSSVFNVSSRIQSEFGAAVVLIHHKSKGEAGQGKGKSYGSIAFQAFSESALYLKGEEPDQDGWVEVDGQYKSSKPLAWGYRFSSLEKVYRCEVRRKAGTQSLNIREEIVNLLTQIQEGCTTEEVLEGIPGATDFLVRKTLKVMQDEGSITTRLEKNPKGGKSKRYWVLST